MSKEFEKFVQGVEAIYYVYRFTPEYYGITGYDYYVLIIAPGYRVPEKYKDLKIKYLTIDQYFNEVLKGSIAAWELACMDKKYVIKEHVKVLMQTNPIQLREQIDKAIDQIGTIAGEDLDSKKILYWRLIQSIDLACQIIDNHKIVNPRRQGDAYASMQAATDEEFDAVFTKFYDPVYQELRKKTDELLLKKKRETALKKIEEREEKLKKMVKKIMFFSASYCHMCKTLHKNLENYDNRIPMEHIDCDTDDDLPAKFNVRNLPTLVYVNNNDEVLFRSTGIVTIDDIYKKIEELNG